MSAERQVAVCKLHTQYRNNDCRPSVKDERLSRLELTQVNDLPWVTWSTCKNLQVWP